jgi:uncharacterized repeat protein (TIGR02543 family)
LNSYTITYDKNPGSTEDSSYNYGATNALNFTALWSRDGFAFLGWSIDSTATVADSTYIVTGDATLYAVWEVSSAATFGSFPDRTISVTVGHYTFVAPSTNSSGVISYSTTCSPDVISISGSVVTFVRDGICEITATIAAAPGFGAASISMTLTITPEVVYVHPVTPPTPTTPTVTGSTGSLTLEYKKPQGEVKLTSTSSADPNENWNLVLHGTDSNGKVTPLDAQKRLEFTQGNKAATSGSGFMPNTIVLLFIGTTELGTVVTDENGAFSASFFIPRSQVSGVRIMQVTGITNNNVLRAVSLPVVFRNAGGLIVKAVYFVGDSPKVTGHGGMVLRAIWALLKGKKNIVIVVSGWVKETADKSYDIRLSRERAQNMVHVLRDIFKIKATYSYKGYGISPENTDKSRRADIVVTFKN